MKLSFKAIPAFASKILDLHHQDENIRLSTLPLPAADRYEKMEVQSSKQSLLFSITIRNRSFFFFPYLIEQTAPQTSVHSISTISDRNSKYEVYHCVPAVAHKVGGNHVIFGVTQDSLQFPLRLLPVEHQMKTKEKRTSIR